MKRVMATLAAIALSFAAVVGASDAVGNASAGKKFQQTSVQAGKKFSTPIFYGGYHANPRTHPNGKTANGSSWSR